MSPAPASLFLVGSLADEIAGGLAHTSGDNAEKNYLAIYCISILFVSMLLVGLHWHKGVVCCISVLCYVYTLSSMSVLVKNVYINGDFTFPIWLTATHFLLTFLVGAGILARRMSIDVSSVSMPSRATFIWVIVPIATTFAVNISSANTALFYADAHFVEMVSASTPLMTVFIGVLLGKGFRVEFIPALLLVTLGVVAVAFGETHFTLLGLTFVVMAVGTRALKANLQSILMSNDSGMTKLNPIEAVTWTCGVCFIVMIMWSAISEGIMPYTRILNWNATVAVLYTAIAACILNIAALYVMKDVGPAAQQMVGQMKGVLACLASVVLYGENIGLQQMIGYGLMIVGITMYNLQDRWMKDANQSKTPLITNKENKV